MRLFWVVKLSPRPFRFYFQVLAYIVFIQMVHLILNNDWTFLTLAESAEVRSGQWNAVVYWEHLLSDRLVFLYLGVLLRNVFKQSHVLTSFLSYFGFDLLYLWFDVCVLVSFHPMLKDSSGVHINHRFYPFLLRSHVCDIAPRLWLTWR